MSEDEGQSDFIYNFHRSVASTSNLTLNDV